MSGLVVGSALVLGGNAAFNWWRFARCRSCRPRCANKHSISIAGNQGILFAAVVLLLVGLMEHML